MSLPFSYFGALLASSAIVFGANAAPASGAALGGEVSPEHQANITAIAQRLCAAANVKPCHIIWAGKNKGALPTDILEGMSPSGWRAALPEHEWRSKEIGQSRQLSNGLYTVVFPSSGTLGHVVIAAVN